MFKELILVVFVDVSQYKFIILWNIAVAPFAGAWIEIPRLIRIDGFTSVAPFAGAWIEIIGTKIGRTKQKSLPSRERGLKLQSHSQRFHLYWSLPSRERGLKSPVSVVLFYDA